MYPRVKVLDPSYLANAVGDRAPCMSDRTVLFRYGMVLSAGYLFKRNLVISLYVCKAWSSPVLTAFDGARRAVTAALASPVKYCPNIHIAVPSCFFQAS